MPLYVPFPACEATPPFVKVMLWDSGMARGRSGEPVCAKAWCSKEGEGDVEGGLQGVAAGVGGRGGGVESLRLPLLLLLLLLLVVAARVAGPPAGTTEPWLKSSSSSREILRYGASDPSAKVPCSCFRPTEELSESESEHPS